MAGIREPLKIDFLLDLDVKGMKQNFAQPFAFLAVKSFPTAMFAKDYAGSAKNFLYY